MACRPVALEATIWIAWYWEKQEKKKAAAGLRNREGEGESPREPEKYREGPLSPRGKRGKPIRKNSFGSEDSRPPRRAD